MADSLSASFQQRLAVSLLSLTLFLGLTHVADTLLGGMLFLAALSAVVGLALREYYQMAEAKGYSPFIRTGCWVSTGYLISCYVALRFTSAALLPTLALFAAIVTLFFQNFRRKHTEAIANIAITVFGFVYLSIPLSYFLSIAYYPFQEPTQEGRAWLVFVVLVTKMTDIGAYIVGKQMGKTPLAPQISPQKSVEGALGGLAFTLITALSLPLLAPSYLQLSVGQSLLFGLSLGIISQLGDLSESLFKRDAGVKDSSRLPGLGGVLDTLDSLVFAVPLCYYLMQVMAI